MESAYQIFTDITTDLTAEWMTANNVVWLFHGLVIDGKEVKDDFGKSVPRDAYYQRLREGMKPTTTHVDMPTFMENFEKALQAGKDVLYVAVSSKLSGSLNTYPIAAEELRAKYPDRRIEAFDTCAISMGQGLIVMKVVEMQRQGYTMDQVLEQLPRLRDTTCHFFTVDDLNHLYRGGRLSRSSALVGSLMGIKPVMYVTEEGALQPLSKIRGRRQAIEELARLVKEHAVEPENQTIYIGHADCQEDADYLAQLVREQIGPREVDVRFLAPVIGAHAGPGTLAIFCTGQTRLKK